jgi:hypothetical protein
MQHPAVSCQGRDYVLHDTARGGIRLVIGDVQAVAADQADAQYDLRHELSASGRSVQAAALLQHGDHRQG